MVIDGQRTEINLQGIRENLRRDIRRLGGLPGTGKHEQKYRSIKEHGTEQECDIV